MCARLATVLTLSALATGFASCSSCEVPQEPVLPADLSGYWAGAYTLYDGTGRPLTDSLLLGIESDRVGKVVGEGVRKRLLPDSPAIETEVLVEGSVVVNTFRIELIDPASRNRALFSGKVDGDTLSGRLSVEGQVMGDLRLVGFRASQ